MLRGILLRSGEAKSILIELGIRPRKSAGQHFLVDSGVLKRCAEYVEIKAGERILEVGPGLGFLTEELLARGAEVVTIESDRKLCQFLRKKFGDKIELIEGDATKVELPEFDKVASNLPYQISSEITFRLLERGFDLAVLMYQKEFAERMVAGEGSAIYGRLSVMTAYRADSEILSIVEKKSFWPQPKVDSAIVRLRSRAPRFSIKDEKMFVEIVRILFSHRRKKIANALISEALRLGYSREKMREFMDEIPYSQERVESLTPEEIGEISDYFLDILKETD